MLNCQRLAIVLLIPLASIGTIHAEESEPKKEEIGKEIVVQLRAGRHDYVEDGKLSEEGTELAGLIIGRHLNPNYMVGVGASFARYKLVRYDDSFREISSEEKPANSFILIARWVFRPHATVQPYADAGIGLTEVIFDGERTSFTLGIGVQFRFNNWGIAIESRGLGWSERSERAPEAANEVSLGYVYFYR